MDKVEQNLAIAEALGTHQSRIIQLSWNPPALPAEDVLEITDLKGKQSFRWLSLNASRTDMDYEGPKDYVDNLNAMHVAVDSILIEAGRKGDWRGWDSYVQTLSEMVGIEGAIEATAAQRAEALLRVLGKWKE